MQTRLETHTPTGIATARPGDGTRGARTRTTAPLRLVGIPFWSILAYLMNTWLFIMAGLSLPDIVRSLHRQELVPVLVRIPIIYLAMVAARFVAHNGAGRVRAHVEVRVAQSHGHRIAGQDHGDQTRTGGGAPGCDRVVQHEGRAH